MISDEIKPAQNKLLTTHNTDAETLVKFLQGKIKRAQLSETMQKKLDRIYQCAEWIRLYGSRLKVAPMLMEKYGLSRSQALTDFQDTVQIMGTTSEQVKGRDFWIDILIGEIMAGMRKSLAAGDHKAHAAYVRTLKDTITDLLGDNESAMYEKFQPRQIILGFFPEMVMPDNVSTDDLLKAAKDLRRKKKTTLNIDDAQYEESDS